MHAKLGSTVRVHYTGTLTNGDVFDSSKDMQPLEFRLGEGKVIQGFDDAVTGMKVGDVKTVLIPALQAYGEAIPELIQELDKSMFPKDLKLEEGLEMYGQNDNGKNMTFTIMEIKENTVIIDGNHFLAGKDLTFELELMEIIN